MRYIFLFIIAFILNGCSPKSLENTVENLFVASSGNKPPNNFKIANIETMRDYVFDMPDYTIALPSAKEEDFTLMNGWEGATFYNKNVVLHMSEFGILYHIYVSTSVYKYEERERAAEYKDNLYLKIGATTQYRKHKDSSETNINVHYETHGKENYPCIVTSSKDNEYTKKGIGYSCFKFNKNKTLVKDVVISLTYSKSPYSDSPNFPKETLDLIKDYTYEDLQERAKRMLDSLYIKDGWDE
jgi:hypothetical protein